MRRPVLSRSTAPSLAQRCTAALALALLGVSAPGSAQTSTPASGALGIYTCVDDKGRRLTSDRPIVECVDRAQRVLNKDGSLKAIHPPTLTADERAEAEARERLAAEARAARADAVRRDRNLIARYPTEAPHQRARESALDTVRLALKTSEARLRELAAERKPLDHEAEFYKGRALPSSLKAALDANDAAVGAQRAAVTTQEAEIDRINRLYDAELNRLRQLWAGAQPGTLGPHPGTTARAPAAR